MEDEVEEIVRYHAIVRGRVQGVGFRYFVLETAQELGLSGWVRNLWDDSVEVTAEGEKAMLLYLEKDLGKGPRMANVTSVESDWSQASGEFSGFRPRSTV